MQKKNKFTSFSREEIKNVFYRSKKLVNESFLDLKKSIEKKNKKKLLIVIPKKVGNSPYRNYLRRCCKEIFRKNLDYFEDFHYVLIFKSKNKEKLSFNFLEKFFLNFLKVREINTFN